MKIIIAIISLAIIALIMFKILGPESMYYYIIGFFIGYYFQDIKSFIKKTIDNV